MSHFIAFLRLDEVHQASLACLVLCKVFVSKTRTDVWNKFALHVISLYLFLCDLSLLSINYSYLCLKYVKLVYVEGKRGLMLMTVLRN